MTDKTAPETKGSGQLALVQELFVKNTNAVRGYLLGVAPDLTQVDDLLHRVFLAAANKADQFDTSRSFLAWVRGIARIEARRFYQEQLRRPHVLSPEVIDMLWQDAPDLDVSTERIALLEECVEELGERPRKAIELRYHKSMKADQIARQLNLAIESVYVTLSRARSSLKACIERKLRERGGTD